jgi:hypothetical protein
MTKEQMETKLSLLPLLIPCTASYSEADGMPQIQISFASIPGPGTAVASVDLDPSEAQLQELASFLPLLAADRLAALAILLAAPLP